ncbi:MAG TPA: transglycosylase domain-containing protein [Segeticoccus sp.]|uniref:transglycosylase domain-containing protein n=1 Tax=Segeticoccus sp. TaxID=2706531 RepID=UPI002D803621|nr:transglycosylase domain-containing protein [Segeticoccus sp.]HET8598803.1 transglycosylase domain-containing protein [Segeticoccus sp.]
MSPSQQRKPAPKKGSKGGKKRRSRRSRILRGALWTVLGLIVLVVIAFVVAYKAVGIPSPNQLAAAQSTVLYYADGKTELDRFGAVNRQSVPLSQVPDHVQKAFLAAEDRNYYQNGGISLSGMARGAWRTLTGAGTQSGSTITQQYVKNYFLTSNQTLSRKFREIIISIKLDHEKSKDEILQDYLNTVYFGRGAYGVQTAAQAYFGKNVSQLNVSQGAFLAELVRGPALYDPANGKQATHNAHARWHYVINGMRTEHWITPQQKANARFPKVLPPHQQNAASGPTGYITQQVKQELENKLHLTEDDLARGGYKVTTTINRQAQRAAVKAVQDNMPSGAGTGDLHAGLTAIKPGDGAVVAMYGGRDYAKRQFNSATDAHLQAGSTFKIFTLLAGLRDHVSTMNRYDGHSPQFFPEFQGPQNPQGKVSNYGDEQFGYINLVTATAHSVNTVFAQLNIQVGPANTMKAAVDAGLPPRKQNCTPSSHHCTPGLNANAANVLGTASPRVIDMANAYATIAARGERATPYLIKKVTGPGEDYSAKPTTTRAFSKDVTADVTDAMEHVVTEGTGINALALGRPAAGKTGTTDRNLAVWFDGFTPQLSAAVAMYKGDGTVPMQNIGGFQGLTGGTYPTKIWTAFMQGALQGQPVEQFPPRAGVNDNLVPTTTAPTTTTPTAPSPTTTTTTVPPSQSSSSSSSPSPTTTTSPSPTTTTPTPTSTAPSPTSPSPTTTPTPTRTKPPASPSGTAEGTGGGSGGGAGGNAGGGASPNLTGAVPGAG